MSNIMMMTSMSRLVCTTSMNTTVSGVSSSRHGLVIGALIVNDYFQSSNRSRSQFSYYSSTSTSTSSSSSTTQQSLQSPINNHGGNQKIREQPAINQSTTTSSTTSMTKEQEIRNKIAEEKKMILDKLDRTKNKKDDNNDKDQDEKSIKKKKDKDDKNDKDNGKEEEEEESFIDKMKKMSYELGQQTKTGIVSYYQNWRYIQEVIKPKQNAGMALLRKDIIHLKTFKIDSLYWIPLGVYLLIPFSTFGLPIYIKYLSAILPSTFSTRQMIVKRKLSNQKHRTKLAKKLFKSLTDKYSKNQQNQHNNNNNNSNSNNTPDQQSEQLQQNNNNNNTTTTTNQEDERIIIRIQDLNRSHLVLLSRCIGIKWAIFMSPSQLQQKLKDWEKEVIQDNRLILREGIQKLSIEDLQDISYQRGIHFKNKTYDQLLFILSKSLSISASPPSHSSYCFSVISSLIQDDHIETDDD
ncbi:hypothetical protein DFA_06451 [Cavenderia fasciculata]|uniref:Letm1 RBD domain-containing protein n=1 Tax=Cavenderia fasciculata TaxID=261658 RepID=F4PJ15_CACFS|nr:uncharacterized protein DFA_06451 [Cavenderia fasciculata]EGG24301.1 hypothetical protein DFA_06451 [Cavenderia fasciculata]|eukprot:XP_004362152.1 hypothetical protein DFA_06451 [Cavenderia fasciculata]